MAFSVTTSDRFQSNRRSNSAKESAMNAAAALRKNSDPNGATALTAMIVMPNAPKAARLRTLGL